MGGRSGSGKVDGTDDGSRAADDGIEGRAERPGWFGGAGRKPGDIALNSCMRTLHLTVLLAFLLSLAGCNSSHLEPAEVQGPAAMVDDGGKQRLWVLTKQEEVKQVGVGGGGRRSGMDWRSDTFFHFAVQAIDPLTLKTSWSNRLLTFGDPEAKGAAPSRVIGSSVDGRLLGQDGNIVWLLIGAYPYALNAADGSLVADPEKLQEINPQLKDLLPSEARHYSFDRGLAFMAADARYFVIRGPGQKAVAYTPPPPAVAEEGPLRANGTREMVPMRPFDEMPLRQVRLGGQWLGLYSEREAVDAGSDDSGQSLRYPWSVDDEGKTSRRRFWRGKIVSVKHFDDVYERLSDLKPVDGSPTFLKGRFKASPGNSDEPLVLSDPESVLIWHSTRVAAAGRLAMTRLGANLKPIWTS